MNGNAMTQTRIDSGRLWLRPFTLDDAPAFLELVSQPEVIRYVGSPPLRTLDEARAALQAAPLQDYATHGYGRLACVDKASGAVIGFCGVKYIAELDDNELGYRLLPQYWGQGLATEAGRAVMADARERLGLRRLIGLVHPDNLASVQVLSRLGFARERRTRMALFGEQDIDVYSRAL